MDNHWLEQRAEQSRAGKGAASDELRAAPVKKSCGDQLGAQSSGDLELLLGPFDSALRRQKADTDTLTLMYAELYRTVPSRQLIELLIVASGAIKMDQWGSPPW